MSKKYNLEAYGLLAYIREQHPKPVTYSELCDKFEFPAKIWDSILLLNLTKMITYKGRGGETVVKLKRIANDSFKNLSEEEFGHSVKCQGMEKYTEKALLDFIEYWTTTVEPTKKMRFQTMDTFNFAARLRRWAKNSMEFHGVSALRSKTITPEDADKLFE